MIVRVGVVLNWSVVHNDWRFDNLCGSLLQRQNESHHFNWSYQTLDIDLNRSQQLPVIVTGQTDNLTKFLNEDMIVAVMKTNTLGAGQIVEFILTRKRSETWR